jgi:Fe-S cluster assembly protein SufD
MDLTRADALAARSHLATHGWIARKAEAFRHLPPPAAALWLGDASELAPWDAVEALADGWSLRKLAGTAADAVQARWLDTTQPDEREELLAGLAAPGDDEAAPFAWAHRALVRQGLRLRIPAGASACLQLVRHACRAVEAPLLRIELAPGARCVLLESHERADGRAAVQNLQVHVQLAAGASLQHLRHVVPAAEDRVAHHLHVQLAAGAHYAQAVLASGSNYHLQRNVLDLQGEGAHAHVGGVLLAAGNAMGGYVVTERMLEMFKSSGPRQAGARKGGSGARAH